MAEKTAKTIRYTNSTQRLKTPSLKIQPLKTSSLKLRSMALLLPLILVGCNTTTTLEVTPVPATLNGVWASSCEFNRESGYYETFDYNIQGSQADILISSYNDSNCSRFIFDEYYQGSVSQTGNVILGNGLDAVALSFSLYDNLNDVRLEYTSYFDTDPYALYEYTETNGQYAFEYTRI